MPSDYGPPSPVLGLVVCGAILVLLEGLIELAIVGIVSSTVTLPGALVAVGVTIAGFTIALAVVILLLAWAYFVEPSGALGIVFIVLGALSFVVGAGFVIGGILIVVGGSLAVFAEWVEEAFAPQWVTDRVPSGQAWVSISTPPPPPPPAPPPPPQRSPAVAWSPLRAGGIVIYRTCPRCGDLVPRDAPTCIRCGGALPRTGGAGAPGVA